MITNTALLLPVTRPRDGSFWTDLRLAGITQVWSDGADLPEMLPPEIKVHALRASATEDRLPESLWILGSTCPTPLALTSLEEVGQSTRTAWVFALRRRDTPGPDQSVYRLRPDGGLQRHPLPETAPDRWYAAGWGLFRPEAGVALPLPIQGMEECLDHVLSAGTACAGCPEPEAEQQLPRAGGAEEWTLFLDRDGVINQRIVGDYIRRPEDFHFLPGVPEALARLRGRFHRMVLVTNQQGIGKGLMTEADLHAVHARMQAELGPLGVYWDGLYHSPYLVSEEPLCRKPRPGMALQALADHPDIDFRRSVMIGDSESDIVFGQRLGMYTIKIGPGCSGGRAVIGGLPDWQPPW